MNIKKITNNRKQFLELLLIADEQESMIDAYIDDGDMFILEEGNVVAESIVVRLSEGIYEIKNIAVLPLYQRKGYGKTIIEYIFNYYKDLDTLYVGTGDSPNTIGFYEKCGFIKSHIKKNFFLDNYDHQIFEGNIQLVDMIYLKRNKRQC